MAKKVHAFNAQTFGVGVILMAIILGVGSQVILHIVDAATAKQCATHDWPKEADTIHKNWCITNGYDI